MIAMLFLFGIFYEVQLHYQISYPFIHPNIYVWLLYRGQWAYKSLLLMCLNVIFSLFSPDSHWPALIKKITEIKKIEKQKDI